MLEHSNGTSMESPRPSRTTTGNHTLLTSNQMVDQPMSDVPLPTQDGGNSGELKEDTLSMRKAKFLKFKTRTLTPMPKTETSRSAIEVMTLDNNGRLFTLTSTLSQRKVN
jgi:hypothetical protein